MSVMSQPAHLPLAACSFTITYHSHFYSWHPASPPCLPHLSSVFSFFLCFFFVSHCFPCTLYHSVLYPVSFRCYPLTPLQLSSRLSLSISLSCSHLLHFTMRFTVFCFVAASVMLSILILSHFYDTNMSAWMLLVCLTHNKPHTHTHTHTHFHLWHTRFKVTQEF